MDPLDSIPQPDERVSAYTLEIPEQDRSLFEQLRANPKISDITDEIAFNKYLRILLQREFERWSVESKRILVDKILGKIQDYIVLEVDEFTSLEADLMKCLPSQNLTTAQANQIRRLLETSGKLAEQHKKITEGMELKINIGDPGVIGKLLALCVYPVVGHEDWAKIAMRARQFAPQQGGSTIAVELDD